MVEFLTAEPILEFDLAGIGIALTQPMLVTTAIVLISMLVVYFLTRDLKVIPEKKKQVIMEAAYNFIYGLVSDNMGEKFMSFVPFIGSIIMFLILVNFVGLIGIQPPTTSFSTTLGLGLTSFVVVQATAIRNGGLGNYIKSYFKPYPFLFPITLLDRLLLPVSLSLRLFGNVVAATTVMSLIYGALHELNFFAQLLIPIPFHMYFDIFDGLIQAVIFTFLTMVQIKIVSDEATGHHE